MPPTNGQIHFWWDIRRSVRSIMWYIPNPPHGSTPIFQAPLSVPHIKIIYRDFFDVDDVCRYHPHYVTCQDVFAVVRR